MFRIRKLIVKVLLFVPWLILISDRAFAENDPIVENYIGITKDRFCWRIDEKELDTFSSIKCHYPSSLKNFRMTNYKIFEWSVFQSSVDLQLKKNECIRQKISAVVNDDKLLEQWATQLKQSWLGMKKAELTLERCEKINHKTQSLPQAFHSPQFLANKNTDAKWKALCDNNELLSQLSAVKDLFVSSMPVVSDSDFFDLMYEQRDGLLNKKTGKPLALDEILEADLLDPSNIELSKKSKDILVYKIKNKFRELSYERKTVSENLVSSKDKKTKVYDIDSATKDFLFEDNTIYQTLEDLKLLGNLDPSSSPQVPMGVKCLLNRYQSEQTAEVAEFAVLSGGWGGIFKVLSLGKLSRLAAFKNKKFWMSVAAGGKTQAIGKIVEVCSSELYQKTKLNSRSGKSITEFDTEHFEKGFAFQFHELEIPAKATPACKGLEKHLVANDFKRSSCLINAMTKQLLAF